MSPKPFKVAKTIPPRTVVLVAVLSLLVLVAVFVAGRYSVELEASSALIAKRELQRELSALRSEHDTLLKQQAFLESARKVDQAAVQETQEALNDLQKQLDVAKSQLAFYQRIVSPEDKVKGLYIESLELIELEDAGGYEYHLTLAQLQRKQPFVKGSVDLLWVDESGKPHSFFTGSKPKQKLAAFGFRYYQLLQGALSLPADAKPVSIEVRVNPSTKGRKPVVNTWPWAEVVSQ